MNLHLQMDNQESNQSESEQHQEYVDMPQQKKRMSEGQVKLAIKLLNASKHSNVSFQESCRALGIAVTTGKRWIANHKNGQQRQKTGRKPHLTEFETTILFEATNKRNERGQPASRAEFALLVCEYANFRICSSCGATH